MSTVFLDEYMKWQKTLSPNDPDHYVMAHITCDDVLIVYWGGYDWWIELDTIKTPLNMLGLLDHILEKEWEHTSADRVKYLINMIAKHKGWKMHPF